MSLWLQQLGVNVVGYALCPPTNPSMFELAKVAEGMVSIESDIRGRGKLNGVSFAAHAKRLHDLIERKAEARYQAKIRGVQSNATKPPTTKGAAAKPQPATAKSWGNAHQGFRASLDAMSRANEEG